MFMEIVDLKISKQMKQQTCVGLGLDNVYTCSLSFRTGSLNLLQKLIFLLYLGWEEALRYKLWSATKVWSFVSTKEP